MSFVHNFIQPKHIQKYVLYAVHGKSEEPVVKLKESLGENFDFYFESASKAL
jgi:hypothetical protein